MGISEQDVREACSSPLDGTQLQYGSCSPVLQRQTEQQHLQMLDQYTVRDKNLKSLTDDFISLVLLRTLTCSCEQGTDC